MLISSLRKTVLVGRFALGKYCRFASEISFPIINGDIDTVLSDFQKKRESYSKFSDKYLEYLTSINSGISQKAIDRHVKINKKLLLKDRLSRILDAGSDFLEISPFAGIGLEYGDIQRGGMLCGIGWISGQPAVVQASDATVKGGTAYPITVKKQLRAQEIAEENNLPCLYLIDSGGAFLPLQANIFPDEQHGGRVFYNEAIMSSKGIPQICVVCGSCTAGGAYIPTMADQSVIVHKIGTIFLGGPPLVRAATGEVVTAEDLGGATVHSSVSGCTDYFGDTEEEAFSMTRDIFASLNPNLSPLWQQRDYQEPLYNAEDLGPLSIHDETKTFLIEKIIARIVDGSKFHEFKAKFGPTLVTGFAFIKGIMVGILANQGPFTSPAALKGAHFVQLCSQQNIPLIFLQDTHPDIDKEPGLAKDLGKLISTVSCAKVPKITVVIGRSHGPSSFAMGSENDDETKIKSQAELDKIFQMQSSAFYSTARLWDDGIILPHQTREVLALSLRASLEKQCHPKTSDSPVLRM